MHITNIIHALFRYINRRKYDIRVHIRTQELREELSLEFVYPDRKIIAYEDIKDSK